MFTRTSRYYQCETATLTTPQGRTLIYVRRRLLPPASPATALAEHVVGATDRLDIITARYLGDPELFWQLCDVNHAMHPDELTAEIGRKLVLALPES